MAQIVYFTNGGFVVHEAYIGRSRCKFSAWFDVDGKLLDAERIGARHRPYPATEGQWRQLAFWGLGSSKLGGKLKNKVSA